MRIRDVLRVNIYQPHLRALLQAFATIRGVDPAFESGLGTQRKYLGNIVKRAFKRLMNSDNLVAFQVK
jgi:predicted metallopeptidase